MENIYRISIRLLPLMMISFLYTQTSYRLGDVNRDGVTDISDIIRTVEIILDSDLSPDDYELWLSDVNADETTDIIDIVITVFYIVYQDGICPDGFSNCPDTDTECCQDTTVADFTWEVNVFSNAGGPYSIYDVAVINENDIWAVGEICTAEINLPEYYEFFNAAHWNGLAWEYLPISVPLVNSQTGGISGYCLCNITSVMPFGPDDIWFSYALNELTHQVGEYFEYFTCTMPLDDDHTNASYAAWGSGPDDIYIGSQNGNIYYFDGSELSEFGILEYPFSITKICGSQDIAYIAARNMSGEYTGQSIVAKVEDGILETVHYSPTFWPDDENPVGGMEALWSFGGDAYIMARGGLYYYSAEIDSFYLKTTYEEGGFANYGFIDMDGLNPNDIALVTNQGQVFHYNGLNWSVETTLSDEYDVYLSRMKEIDLKGNTLAISLKAQFDHNWGAAAIGTRNSRR